MTGDLETADRAEIQAVLDSLAAAWDRGDGAGFAAPFAEDADFINILGMHLRGRAPIAAQHDRIFTGIYAGSTAALHLTQARWLADGVAYAVVDCAIEVPTGPWTGRVETKASAVLVRTGGGWRIAAFHNTRLGEMPSGT